jgi:hypothetical protein
MSRGTGQRLEFCGLRWQSGAATPLFDQTPQNFSRRCPFKSAVAAPPAQSTMIPACLDIDST